MDGAVQVDLERDQRRPDKVEEELELVDAGSNDRGGPLVGGLSLHPGEHVLHPDGDVVTHAREHLLLLDGNLEDHLLGLCLDTTSSYVCMYVLKPINNKQNNEEIPKT